MSEPLPSELDFWEFVACSRCQISFIPEPGAPPQVPFWLTECGHIICNNHLNPDQNCAQCGARDIQLAPLQREMDPPMSDWFRSLPHALDGIASTAKFQHEVLCYQVRHYKARYKQAREIIEKIKREAADNKVLRKTIEELRHQNDQLRQRLGFSSNTHQHSHDGVQDVSDIGSSNKKRRLHDPNCVDSSPHSITTPVGPNRLTLPPGQMPPSLSSRRTSEEGQDIVHHPNSNQSKSQRPSSSRFEERYAYVPPKSSQYIPQPLSHAQNAPIRQQFTRQRVDLDQTRPVGIPIPQASTSKFKPAPPRPPMNMPQGSKAASMGRRDDSDRRQTDMRPPQVPGNRMPGLSVNHCDNAVAQSFSRNVPGTFSNPNYFKTTAHGQFSVPNTADAQRFAPPVDYGSNGPQRFIPGTATGSRAPSRSTSNFNGSAVLGAQRAPFMSGTHGGIG